MEIIIVQVFVSLVLVSGSLILFAISAKQRDYEHADRLALLPMEDDEQARSKGDPASLPSGSSIEEKP